MEYNSFMAMGNRNNQSLSVEAFFSIVHAEIFAWEALEAALRENGVPITVGRLIPLHYLVDAPLRLQDLTECTHAKSSAASRMVERMVNDGLIEKRRDACDGRAVMLHITDEGRRVEAAGWSVFERCAADMFDDFDEGELRELRALLERVEASGARAGADA